MLLVLRRVDTLEVMNPTGDDLSGNQTSNFNEQALITNLKSGDEAAFEAVVRAYWPRLISVARRFLPNEQDAQDAVQDAFLMAFRGLDGFHQQSRLGTWLHRIVVNAALMKLRARSRRPEGSIDEFLPTFNHDGHLANPVAQWAISLDTAVSQHEIQEVVRHNINQLPDSYRAVLLLRDIEERSTEETAELLGISDSAVKTRLHRARQALRTLLDPYMTGMTS